ncbi:hypothetical protein T440DRAFT_44021 [Plenodomus tracheiphilus IPT5]|uniref:Uncharacterized protein n=1 Tax=Plenodomus tracheiphilus IPT5 TaxID=1408161 RepID=A0A6A7AQ19_9PLEO|nr:hypothetical protein T440DRAFT_44021 [Plenodomus tracheiphilus IPT5]
MDQRYLPDPSQFGFQGRSRGTLESVMHRAVAPGPEPSHVPQLPPIREPLSDQHSMLSSVPMSRGPFEAPQGSPNDFGYDLSRSFLRTTSSFLESDYHSALPGNWIAMHTACFSPGRVFTTPAPKAINKKRTHRKKYFRLKNESNGALPMFNKNQEEAVRRYGHSVYLSKLEREMRKINPRLPEVANQGNDNLPGWKSLKRNNRCEDVMEIDDESGEILLPYSVNKNNIYLSSYYVILNFNELIHSTCGWIHSLEAEARSLSQRDPTKEELLALVCKIRDSGAAPSIAMADSQRGAIKFRIPFSQT